MLSPSAPAGPPEGEAAAPAWSPARGGAEGAEAAAAGARQVMLRSGTSFGAAFVFLDRPRRQALDAVYAFCRLVDDAVDDAPDPAEARRRLADWRLRLERVYQRAAGTAAEARDALEESTAEGAVERALLAAVRRFPIEHQDLAAVIEGCEWDLAHPRYPSWEQLRQYCLRVASAVGLACIAIFGASDPRSRDYAIDLGLALQLTNILRDVDEDAARGRIYLPLDELRDFGVSEGDLLSGRRSPERARLMHFQAQRARLHFARARAAIPAAERRRLVAAEIMGDIYHALLERLEREGFPPRRLSLSKAEKALRALGCYLRWRLLPIAW